MVSKVASYHLATSQKLAVTLCTGQLLWAHTKLGHQEAIGPNSNKVPCHVSSSMWPMRMTMLEMLVCKGWRRAEDGRCREGRLTHSRASLG